MKICHRVFSKLATCKIDRKYFIGYVSLSVMVKNTLHFETVTLK